MSMRKKKLYQFSAVVILLFTIKPLFATNYSVNLMWLNKSLQPTQQFIHPATSLDDLNREFVDKVIGWAALQSEDATVNVWYDSVLTPALAIENTRRAIEQKISALEGAVLCPIWMMDIRELPTVQENPDVFSDITLVYFRADLARAIAAFHLTSDATEPYYFVYSDIDLQPISTDNLFDDKTMLTLREHGMVMARDSCSGFENSFQIISNHKPHLLEAMKWALIDLNTIRAQVAINDRKPALDGGKLDQYELLREMGEIVYMSYTGMFAYFYHLENKARAWVDCGSTTRCSTGIPDDDLGLASIALYNKIRDGLKPFNFKMHFGGGSCTMAPYEKHFEILDRSICKEPRNLDRGVDNLKIPTKQVKLPACGLCYNK